VNTRDLDALTSEASEALIKASEEFEDRIKNYGVTGAHEWMFAVREALHDLRRLEVSLCALYSARDREDAARLCSEYVEMWLYQVLPHIQAHMTELEHEMDRVRPGRGSTPQL